MNTGYESLAVEALKRLVRARQANKQWNRYGGEPHRAKEQAAAMRNCTKLGEVLLRQEAMPTNDALTFDHG
jgi:hypothetical protein